MQLPIPTIVQSVQLARESFAAVKRNDATVEQHDIVKQLTDAKVDGLVADINAAAAPKDTAVSTEPAKAEGEKKD